MVKLKRSKREREKKMRYPDYLKKNGTIGFVAPAFGCNIEPYKSAFDNAQRKFKQLGYKLAEGLNCRLGEGIGISNTPEKCGQELNAFFESADVDCLLSCGGGELMCEVVPHIDFEAIKQHPAKWYMGYSDNTNMTFLLATLCDTASIYGPCAPAFGMEPWHPAIEDAFKVLTGETLTLQGYDQWEKESLKDEEHPLTPYHVTEPVIRKCFQGTRLLPENETVRVGGRLLGGCMDCLSNLVGTRYDKVSDFAEHYREDGILWFLEACDLNVFSIRRALWQFEQAGWFQHVKGFLIGRPLCFGQEMMGLDAYSAVTGILGKYNVPILMDVDLGHLPPMMPLITGSVAQVEASARKMQVKMQLR